MVTHTTKYGTALTSKQQKNALMEYLESTKLNILNQGEKPSFVVSNRNEVIDLILGTDKAGQRKFLHETKS
jgi:hypothetical protein